MSSTKLSENGAENKADIENVSIKACEDCNFLRKEIDEIRQEISSKGKKSNYNTSIYIQSKMLKLRLHPDELNHGFKPGSYGRHVSGGRRRIIQLRFSKIFFVLVCPIWQLI